MVAKAITFDIKTPTIALSNANFFSRSNPLHLFWTTQLKPASLEVYAIAFCGITIQKTNDQYIINPYYNFVHMKWIDGSTNICFESIMYIRACLGELILI